MCKNVIYIYKENGNYNNNKKMLSASTVRFEFEYLNFVRMCCVIDAVKVSMSDSGELACAHVLVTWSVCQCECVALATE